LSNHRVNISSHEHTRTKNYIIQVCASVFAKFLTIAFSMAGIRILVDDLGLNLYGIWSTVIGLIAWGTILDFGLGSSLRNRVSELLAKKKFNFINYEISESYRLIFTVSVVVILCGFIVIENYNWTAIFDKDAIQTSDLEHLLLLSIMIMAINNINGISTNILHALQKSSLINYLQLASGVLFFIAIYFVSIKGFLNIKNVINIYFISIIIPNLLIFYWMAKKFTYTKPKLSNKIRKYSLLTKVNKNFFVIQLSYLFICASDRILIITFFGPEEVAKYDLIYKIFGLILIANSVIVTPLWSTYSEAFHRNDIGWIGSMIKKQIAIFLIALFTIIIIALNIEKILYIWIDKIIYIYNSILITLVLFTAIYIWNSIFSQLLNGIGKIKAQYYVSLITMVINVPVAILLIKKFELGVSGVILASCLSLAISGAVATIESFYYFRKEKFIK
jgi:O-antigen/teichoic acid export membrane protein